MRSSAVEHYIDIVGVTGSIPVASTIFSLSGITGFSQRNTQADCYSPSRPDRPGIAAEFSG